MLMEVKRQFRVSLLTIKYSLMREMLNKATFVSNIVFMILNNACFIIQWLVLYSIKDNVGGYSFKEIILLWGIAASTFGFSRFFFRNAFNLSDTIVNGKLDAFLVQPKNVLISAITTDISTSAIGDLIYGLIMLCIYNSTLKNFVLFTLFTICGGLMITSIAVIFASFSFWFTKADMIADTMNSQITNFATYPDGIFKGTARVILYTLVPVGLIDYIPISIIGEFNIWFFIIVICSTIWLVIISFLIFNKGLKRYSSSNLMISRI